MKTEKKFLNLNPFALNHLLVLSLTLTAANARALASESEAQATSRAQIQAPAPTVPTPSIVPEPAPEPAPAPAPPLTPVGQTSQMFGVHTTLGIPHPFSFGLDFLTETKLFEINLNFGAAGAVVNGVTLSLTNSEIGLLYHPFAGSFFVGALLGKQILKAKNTGTLLGSANVTAEVNVITNYVTPHLGWHWVWNSGFSLGLEAGYQVPTSSQTDLSTNATTLGIDTTNPTYVAFEKDVKDQGDRIGKQGLPHLALFRFGWMF